MPQLIVLAVAGAGLLAGYKWLSRKLADQAEAERVRAQAEAVASGEADAPKEMGSLVWDAESKAYRPGQQ
jgi:hypothetical protein